jgi:hypothetical protein
MIIGLVLISGMLLAAGLCCLVVALAHSTPAARAGTGADWRRGRGPHAIT